MKRNFNALSTIAIIGFSIICSSCETTTYDEDELNRDIEKKLNEMKAEEEAELLARTIDIIDFAKDSLILPVRVTYELIEPESPSIYDYNNCGYYKYHYNPSDKDVIIKSLFEQTATLSEYGNFDWDEARANGHKYGEPLKDFIAGSESTLEDNLWFFVTNNVVKIIAFSEDSDNSYFTIYNHWSQIDEDGNVQAPQIPIPEYITPNGNATNQNDK